MLTAVDSCCCAVAVADLLLLFFMEMLGRAHLVNLIINLANEIDSLPKRKKKNHRVKYKSEYCLYSL